MNGFEKKYLGYIRMSEGQILAKYKIICFMFVHIP